MNGKRIFNFCMDNNSLIINTCFEHKQIHMYTREVRSRNEKSIIDYMLINREHRNEVLDVREGQK